MSTDVLQNFYIDDPRCLQIAEGLSLSRPSEIALTGLLAAQLLSYLPPVRGMRPNLIM